MIKIKSNLPPRPKAGEVLSYLGWTLLYIIGDVLAALVKVGDVVETSKGDTYRVQGGNPPHKPSSSGFVWVAQDERGHPRVLPAGDRDQVGGGWSLMAYAIGDRVKATRFGKEVRGVVVPHPTTGNGPDSIVFVRFDGSKFTNWMHPESLELA